MVESPGDEHSGIRVFTVERVVTRGERDEFLEIPFDVPEGTEEVSVYCEVEGYDHAGSVLDLGLKDPHRVRGASGSARSEFWVSESGATPGYLPGEITPGRWAVLLNLPLCYKRIPPEGCLLSLTIHCVMKKPHWLRGDLHVHSIHSDGQYRLAELAYLAQEVGLDFVALTDHNTVSQNFAYPRETNVIFVPGVELSTRRGDTNILGVADPFDDFRVDTMEALCDRLSRARRRDATVVLNHPHDDALGWVWGWDVEHDCIEVWNGSWRERDQRTLDWWQGQLAAGKRLVVVGGSDTHGPHQRGGLGTPTTWAYSSSRSVQGILAAIKEGHVFLSYCPESPLIDMRCGPFVVGDEAGCREASASGPVDMQLMVYQLMKGDTVRVISDRGVEQETCLSSDKDILTLTWPVGKRRFYRAEIWRYFAGAGEMQMAAMSNPIYFAYRPIGLL